VLKNTRRGLDLLFLTRNHSTLEWYGWILDSSRWESMLGRDGEQKLLFGTEEKKLTVGRQGGINTLRSGSAMVTFETSKPPV
jgi:hypothetical protein